MVANSTNIPGYLLLASLPPYVASQSPLEETSFPSLLSTQSSFPHQLLHGQRGNTYVVDQLNAKHHTNRSNHSRGALRPPTWLENIMVAQHERRRRHNGCAKSQSCVSILRKNYRDRQSLLQIV